MFRFTNSHHSVIPVVSGLICFSFLVSCAGLPPIKEYSLAREAISQAEKHKADKHYPGYYGKALKLYRSGESAFKDRYYDRAGDRFEEAAEYAERSEDLTRIKRARVGDHGF
ncbi:MAG: hypothetical protein OXB86_05795 [Bdellovibrionales bacterium]|nr:hypothetical protein [Bdellovibrionales bacterium]